MFSPLIRPAAKTKHPKQGKPQNANWLNVPAGIHRMAHACVRPCRYDLLIGRYLDGRTGERVFPLVHRLVSAARLLLAGTVLNRELPAIPVRIVKPQAHMRRARRCRADLVAGIFQFYAVFLQHLEPFV